ncbi:MAG: glycosyltransferase family 8 protein [Verrucomicrobiia bacterium]
MSDILTRRQMGKGGSETDFRRWKGPLVLAADEAYAMPLATTLQSIVEANRSSWPVEVHVLSTGFSKSTRAKVCASLPAGAASVCWDSVDLAAYKGFMTQSHISMMTYTRFLIAEVLPEGVSRTLYLDSDLLVLDDLAAVWETELDGAVLGAVVDEMEDGRKRGDLRFEGVPRVREYFNAGVLLIDLKRWREERISEKAMAYLSRNPRSPFSDQDALNVACDGLWKKLDRRWNFQSHHSTPISEMRPKDRPGIVHFVTNSKPWLPEARSVNAGFYNNYRSRTCFARTPVEQARDEVLRSWAGVRNVIRRLG